MTLGQYIDFLETSLKTNPEDTILPVGLGNPHSWRGDYSELSFEPVENISLRDMLTQAKSAVNQTFTGYKGGEFKMTTDTPIHIDLYGQWSDGGHMWSLLLSLLIPSKQAHPTPKPIKTPMIRFSDAPATAALELIDGAYDIVELYKPEGPYNTQWRQAWLTKARELGITSDW